MELAKRIETLSEWGDWIRDKRGSEEFQLKLEEAYHCNRWFTREYIDHALDGILTQFLDKHKLEEWLDAYNMEEGLPRLVGLIMAGNIPLVGFHDLICLLSSGHMAMIKLSSRDEVLWPYLLNGLGEVSLQMAENTAIVDKLEGFDAVIATGSNNTSRYFEYYFGSHPHIIRRNRNSVAVLSGEESEDQLLALGNDIFRYFGLGCRNVSRLFVPEGYDFQEFFGVMEAYRHVDDHSKYNNNYQYHRSLLLMNQDQFLDNGFLILREQDSLASPVASLHYTTYKDIHQVSSRIREDKDLIQCVVAKNGMLNGIDVVRFGETQQPSLDDYADRVDTMKFLLKLKQ